MTTSTSPTPNDTPTPDSQPTPDSSPTPADASSYAPSAPDVRTYRVTWRSLFADWPLIVALVAATIFAAWAWPQTSETVPIHWGIDGQPDDWGPAWINVWMPLGLAWGLYLGLLFVPLLDTKRKNYAAFEGSYRALRFGIVAFSLVVHVTLTLVALGYDVDLPLVLRIGLPTLFFVIGAVFANLRHNNFVGIRVPWTLKSEAVWNKTHRMAGGVWMGGAALMLACALLPPELGFVAMMGVVVVMVIVPIVYSYRIFKDAESTTEPPQGD